MKKIILGFLLIAVGLTSLKAQIITTIAGNGIQGSSGDGGPATAAELGGPHFVTLDDTGNIFIADYANARIRKINQAGIITTFAGIGAVGYSGDGGQATSAELFAPTCIVFDAEHNAYIADAGNARIRKITTAGVITTIAGDSTAGYNSDGIQATMAELSHPTGVAIDNSGNVYIADENNNRIRKVNSAGIISTIAGTGTPGYNGDGIAATSAQLQAPTGITVDTLGNLYIADYYNARIRKIDNAGTISTIAGNGTEAYSGNGVTATSAELYYPYSTAIDTKGNVYIADGYNAIRKVSFTGIITTIAGDTIGGYSGDNGPATAAELNSPQGVFIDAEGNIYIADTFNDRIRKVAALDAGIDEIADLCNIIVYPNPFTTTTRIIFNKGGIHYLDLYDIAGRKMETIECNRKQYELQRNNLASGIYFIKAFDQNQSYIATSKVIIQ
ncbi:MAG: T9SS type A sorting domain-containing protein [Bacteroidia bacterium]